MRDFSKIKSLCDRNSTISKSVVDKFLLYRLGEKEGQIKVIVRQLAEFRHIINKMAENWTHMLISQLLAYDLFKKDGSASRLLDQSEVQGRSPEEVEYLKFQIEHPWRFTFCSIENHLVQDFYEMKDAVSGKTFLLHSPGISESNTGAGGVLRFWFLLVWFNGECYQTYGPLAYFKGIQPFDLFFFAKLIKPDIVFQNEVQDVIESNPIPFTMLFSGAEIPVTYCKRDMAVFSKSEYYVKDFLLEKYAQDFIIQKKHPIYMLSLRRWNSFPHFAKCYYHAKKNLFIITSMTVRGYDKLIENLNKQGNDFPQSPELFVTPAMHQIAKNILNIDVQMNPYEKHFAMRRAPEGQEELDRINMFLKSLIDRLNNHEEYDISELASNAGIDISEAERIAENVIKKVFGNPREK